MDKRLEQQMQFILEMDKLKSIFRQSYLIGTTRKENDAEHSWHLAMMVLIFSEHSNADIDVLKVLKMVLIHDIVEIDAGDTFCYDEKAAIDKSEREQQAAKRILDYYRMTKPLSLNPYGKSLKRQIRLMPSLHDQLTD